MTDIETWFKGLPEFSKYWLTSALVATCVTSFGIFNPYLIILDFNLIYKRFEIWRLLTNFIFFGNFGFPFVIWMWIMIQYSQKLEKDPSFSKKADFYWCIAFCMVVLLIFAYI